MERGVDVEGHATSSAASLPVTLLAPPTCDDRAVRASEGRRPTRALVFTLALVTLAVGYGQFGSTSALGNVAKAFGIAREPVDAHRARGASRSRRSPSGIAILRAASLARAAARARSPTASGGTACSYACGVAGLCVTASPR